MVIEEKMSLKELQELANKVIETIDSKIGAKHDSDTTMMHLYEEMGEISRELVNEKLGRDKINIDNLKEEIADVLLFISRLASLYNLDLEDSIKEKIKKLGERHGVEFE